MSSTNGAVNGGGASKKPQYDPNFTDSVIAATGPKASPRIRQVMTSLIKHVHDFARENDITVSEWMQGVELLNRSGQMSNDRRNETQLLCDVIGLESLVDEITNKLLVGADYESTKSAILGPFFRKDTPPTENDASIIKTMPSDGEIVYMHGLVTDAATGKPLEGVTIDIWQCSTNGLYEQQDPDQADFNLRGKFTTDKNGYYGLYCIRPVPYPVPYDGECTDRRGRELNMTDTHRRPGRRASAAPGPPPVPPSPYPHHGKNSFLTPEHKAWSGANPYPGWQGRHIRTFGDTDF